MSAKKVFLHVSHFFVVSVNESNKEASLLYQEMAFLLATAVNTESVASDNEEDDDENGNIEA